MEPSTIGLAPGTNQVFEARPAVHAYLVNTLGEEHGLPAHSTWAYSLSFSFLSTLRMYSDVSNPSSPVKTPSYNPRFKLQLFRFARLWAASEEDYRTATLPNEIWSVLNRRNSSPAVLLALELDAAHYSNGQKGCAFTDHRRDPGQTDSDYSCTALSTPESHTFNIEDGSFSTDYISANVIAKYLVPEATHHGKVHYSVQGEAGLEWDPVAPVFGSIERPLQDRYGKYAVRGALEGRFRLWPDATWTSCLGTIPVETQLRATLEARQRFGLINRDTFGDVSFEVAWVLSDVYGGPGLFARYHRGRDYLNMRFEQSLNEWLFGVILDPTSKEAVARDNAFGKGQ